MKNIVSEMSRSEGGLIIFASLLMAAIVISYVCQSESVVESGIFHKSSVIQFEFPAVVEIKNDQYEEWRPQVLPAKMKKLNQEDMELILYIRNNWMLPPPAQPVRRLSHPETYDYSEFGQSFVVDKLLRGREKGFYVDVWAGNGETDSNTLFMEKDRRWTGLLIEPNPTLFRSLLGKRRHTYLLNACVSPTRHPSVLNLTYGDDNRSMLVQCFPLYSILKALGVSHVDYLSMKSQLELDILKTLPLEDGKLTVDTMTVETHLNKNRRETMAAGEQVKEYMATQGYMWVDSGEKINKKNVILHREESVPALS